jgi:hypothetical protein
MSDLSAKLLDAIEIGSGMDELLKYRGLAVGD